MTYYLLSFNTTNGTKRSLKINNPVTGLSTEELENAIEQIIANDVFDPAKGNITGFNGLELVSLVKETIM
jgi:hypothetical protein